MLWAEKQRYVDRPETEAMLWGKLLEPVILDVLGNHGYDLIPAVADGYRDPERPWLIGHPDAFASKDGARLVVDAKTTSAWNGSAWGADDAPTAYVCQLMHYMHLTGDDRGLLACLIGGQRLELRTVERDQETINLLLAGEEDFMRLVRRAEPPDPDGADSAGEALRAMFPGESGRTHRLSREGERVWRELQDRDEQYKTVKRQRDELKQRLQAMMGDAEVALTLSDQVAAKWTLYMREGRPSRRFTVHS
jgi:predicted phage-related endonuclease